MTKRLLSIAGSDSSGGAGIQADIKTASALGVYAATAITAVTAQNTRGVTALHTIPANIVTGQIIAVLNDIGADAIKVGMLANAEICEAVARSLEAAACPIVVDPVMVATSGDRLLDPETINILLEQICPLATVITPNLPEFDVLFPSENPSEQTRLSAAQQFVERTGVSVLLKGGHADGPIITNLLVSPSETRRFETKRLETRHTHGTGCTLATAIACYLAQGETLPQAVMKAGQFVYRAIEKAPGLGAGHGPLDFLGLENK